MSKKSNSSFSRNSKLVFCTLLLVLTLVIGLYLLLTSFIFVKAHIINYQQSSNIDYKVYLKDNNFYDEDYLDKNMSYISSLIKNVKATFNYDFELEEKSNIDFTYEINGILTIKDINGKNAFYQKKYSLLNSKEKKLENDNKFSINENLIIDYDYYNSIANEFRSRFGVNTVSNFTIVLSINAKNNNNELSINNKKEMSMTIPLSEREVKIDISTAETNDKQSIVKPSEVRMTSKYKLIFGTICTVISIVTLYGTIKLLFIYYPKKSKYDIYISKILKEYDRFIVNTSTKPSLSDDDKIVEIKAFQELLDVRDNLKLPIKYYNAEDHHKSVFYITNDREVYINTVNSNDFEK